MLISTEMHLGLLQTSKMRFFVTNIVAKLDLDVCGSPRSNKH